ncbi:MAG TPA: hypothetical protein VFH64_03150, partial [Amnibacterium sp.]|nr:hypothetical protein [Amnibacterium sp.]
MSIDPRRFASLLAVATLVAGLAVNVALGSGADALTATIGASPASSRTTPTPGPAPVPTRAVTPGPAPTPTPTPLPEPVATWISRTSGGTAARLTVWMRGSSMANVARVVVGDQD